MKNGFTLVELSIVLVAIGLLISGVLIGQSLIDKVRLDRFQSHFTQYEILINQFKQKYKFLPGDIPSSSPLGSWLGGSGSNYGNGDNLYSSDEGWLALWHMSSLGFINKKLDVDFGYRNHLDGEIKNPYACPGEYVIASGTTGHPASSWTGYGGNYRYNNMYYSAGFSTCNRSTGAMTPLQAAYLDNKYDDGKPSAGKIFGINGNKDDAATYKCVVHKSNGAAANATSLAYDADVKYDLNTEPDAFTCQYGYDLAIH